MADECPYQSLQEELDRHAVLQKDLEDAYRSKQRILRTLNVGEDGWVPIQRWIETEKACKELYAQWLEEARVKGGAEAVEPAKRMWPWDMR